MGIGNNRGFGLKTCRIRQPIGHCRSILSSRRQTEWITEELDHCAAASTELSQCRVLIKSLYSASHLRALRCWNRERRDQVGLGFRDPILVRWGTSLRLLTLQCGQSTILQQSDPFHPPDLELRRRSNAIDIRTYQQFLMLSQSSQGTRTRPPRYGSSS